MTSNFVTTLVKSIVTCKNDVVIESVEEAVVGDSSKHFISVPLTITVRGRYLHNDVPFEISFFAKRKLETQMLMDARSVSLFLNEKLAYERLLPNLDLVSGIKQPRPEFYGASEDFTLLQNLRSAGYRTIDMMVGADLEHTKYILRRLAQFHASSLKLKLEQPDEFALANKYITASFYNRWIDTFGAFFDMACQPAYEALSFAGRTKVVDYIRENDIFTIDAFKSFFYTQAEDELLNLFTHSDTKSDNMMFLYENWDEAKTGPDNSVLKNHSKIADLKFIDFQTLHQSSIFVDILIFLGTSVNTSLFKSDFEQLLKSYFEDFLTACDQMEIASPPSWDSFWRELDRVSGSALIAIVCYLPTHSLKFSSEVDWSSVDMAGAREIVRNADRTLYRKKLLDYVETLSKYFMKSL